MTAKTQPPAPQLALIALSEAADGGTWDFQEEMTEFYNDEDGNSCGGHPIGNYYIWDKDGPNEDDAWIHPHHKENAEFICALVNWFRANYSAQSRPEAELPEVTDEGCVCGWGDGPHEKNDCDNDLPPPFAMYVGTHEDEHGKVTAMVEVFGDPGGQKQNLYTEDHMRAYGQQCAATRQTVASLPPMEAPLPTIADAEAAIDTALSDALKAVNVLSTMLRKVNLQGFAVADEVAGSIVYAQKMRAALAATRTAEVGGVAELVKAARRVEQVWQDSVGNATKLHLTMFGVDGAGAQLSIALEKFPPVPGSEVRS